MARVCSPDAGTLPLDAGPRAPSSRHRAAREQCTKLDARIAELAWHPPGPGNDWSSWARAMAVAS